MLRKTIVALRQPKPHGLLTDAVLTKALTNIARNYSGRVTVFLDESKRKGGVRSLMSGEDGDNEWSSHVAEVTSLVQRGLAYMEAIPKYLMAHSTIPAITRLPPDLALLPIPVRSADCLECEGRMLMEKQRIICQSLAVLAPTANSSRSRNKLLLPKHKKELFTSLERGTRFSYTVHQRGKKSMRVLYSGPDLELRGTYRPVVRMAYVHSLHRYFQKEKKSARGGDETYFHDTGGGHERRKGVPLPSWSVPALNAAVFPDVAFSRDDEVR